jgi:hypothetical protein
MPSSDGGELPRGAGSRSKCPKLTQSLTHTQKQTEKYDQYQVVATNSIRLKIRWWKHRAGSSPARGTNLDLIIAT